MKDKRGKERDKGWTCDLVPKGLIVVRYFAEEQAAIDALASKLESVTAKCAELEEEHGGEEGAFGELDKINKASVTGRPNEIRGDEESANEASVLGDWLKLNGAESEIKKHLREAETALDAHVYAHYPMLTEDAIKTLAVDDKWLARLDSAIHGEMDCVSQQLTQCVKELAERYGNTMPAMVVNDRPYRATGGPG